MSRQGVTLMCYWNGRTTSGPHGISYEGAAPKPIRVIYGITHHELVDRIFGITGFDKQYFKLKIICRYPACREYIPVPIDDDESIDIMFDVARQPGTNCLELYVEKEPLCNDNPIIGTEPSIVDNQASEQMVSQSALVESFLDPGPVDNSVLVLQNQHRSEMIWAGEDPGVLTCRHRLAAMMKDWQLDHRIRHFIIEAGFYGVYRVGFLQLDFPLITALVERWRPETHTFHFTIGESTITLQDVAILLGVKINGCVVTGNANLPWEDLCDELLGVRPDPSVIHGSALKLSWLRTHFREPPPDADDITLQRHARAYILGLMGSLLFTDKSGADVQLMFLPLLRDLAFVKQFSWGSAALAHLYRELCRASKKGASEIAGPLILLQIWAWEHLHIGQPEKLIMKGRKTAIWDRENEKDNTTSVVGDAVVLDDEQLPADPLGCRWRAPVIRRDNPHRALIFYRDQLDQQTDLQMVWQPYTSERLASLPDSFLADQHVWRTVAPLVCFDIVEWHRPDRVLRQFGLYQEIPVHCDTEVKLHTIDRRGRHHYDWKAYHERYIKLWESREESIATGKADDRPMRYHDPYMVWFRSITRRLITPLTQRSHMRFQPSSGTSHLLIQSLTTIYNDCMHALDSFTGDGAMKSLENIQSTCFQVLQMIGETRHLEGKHTTMSTKPITTTTLCSSHSANEAGDKQSKDSALPIQASIVTSAPLMRGRGRGRGGTKGKVKGRGRGNGSVQYAEEAAVEITPQSSLSTQEAFSTASHIGNGRPRLLPLKELEIGTIGPADLLAGKMPLEGARQQSVVESMGIYDGTKRDLARSPAMRSINLSKGDKMIDSISTSLLELEREAGNPPNKDDMETTRALRVGSKMLLDIQRTDSGHLIIPKKKPKHV